MPREMKKVPINMQSPEVNVIAIKKLAKLAGSNFSAYVNALMWQDIIQKTKDGVDLDDVEL